MDMRTLLTHRELWVTEKTQISRDLPHLTASEREVFDVLPDQPAGPAREAGTERIAFEQVRRRCVDAELGFPWRAACAFGWPVLVRFKGGIRSRENVTASVLGVNR